MEVDVFTVLFAQRPFGEALDVIKATGCEAVETGTVGAPGNAHCDLDSHVDSDQAQKKWMDKITSRGLEISALSCRSMDRLVCIREQGDVIYHIHMKDTWLDRPNIRCNGVLDTKAYNDEKHRSWIFRTHSSGHRWPGVATG